MEKFAFRVAIDSSHQARVITAYIEQQRRGHQLGVAHVIVFVLVQTLEPRTVRDRILFIVMANALGHILARQAARNKVRHVIGSVRTKIEARAVKRINESSGIADQGPTVTADFFTVIRQHRESVYVPFDYFRSAEDFPTDGVIQNVRMQSLPQSRSLRKFENATVINNAGADIAALQRNDPDPPAAPEKMICGPFAPSATMVRVFGKSFAPFVAVPFFNAAESRPDRVDGMLGVWAKMSEFSSEHGRASCSINGPTASSRALRAIDNCGHCLFLAVTQIKTCDLRGPP